MPRSSTPSRRPSSLRCSLRSRTSPVISRCCATSCAPTRCCSALPQGGLNEEQQAAARALALATSTRFRDDGGRPAPPPSDAELRADHGVRRRRHRHVRVRAVARGGARAARRGPPRPELAPSATSRPTPSSGSSSSVRGCRACSPRTGCSAAGVDFVVLEKNDDVGGTWYENSYPGCRVDNPNHNYSYSFAQRHDWPFHFSSQDVLLDYFRRCANDFGVRDRIQFGTEVLSATWSDADGHWTIRVRRADGAESSIEANAVISAVGQLNRPSFPPIKGRDSFAGPSFHSARWDHSLDLRGKRVAVIGTGASAVQFIPEIADVGRAPRGVPADPAVDGADTRVPRRGARGIALAVRARPVVQRVESLLDLLEDGRRRASRRAGRSGVGARRALGRARSTT